MYKVTNGDSVKSAFTMKQAFYYAENINRKRDNSHETTIELPDGCILVYDPSHGDLVCKQPTSITFATPSQAASIFSFFFEGVERGWIDLSHTPLMRNLHDWLVDKRECETLNESILEKCAISRVFDITQNQENFTLTELCDDYFSVELSCHEIKQLAFEIFQLSWEYEKEQQK